MPVEPVRLSRRFLLASSTAALAIGAIPGLALADPVSIDDSLAALRVRYGLPGVAAMVLRGGAVVAKGVAGVRSVTTSVPVSLGDPFVIGSCGKSLTATIAARMVARGAIWFETTLAQVFPDLAGSMQPAYRTATLAMLLAHRSGLPQVPPIPLPVPGGPATQRASALPTLLALPPHGLPGQTFEYSNVGYVVAGAMLERVAGMPFEALAALELFQPLGLLSAGFGAPVEPAPQGHTAFWLPLPSNSEFYPPLGAAPAGLFHLSLPDWARYADLHMGLGPTEFLPPEALARLHQPWSPDLGESYALGWHVSQGSWGTELRHNGSDGYWSARIRLVPALGYAVLMATNMLGFNVEPASEELESTLMQLFPPA
ncbi:MAG: serine hydrolase domain-containing protein [Geminicoccaceae bacterium]